MIRVMLTVGFGRTASRGTPATDSSDGFASHIDSPILPFRTTSWPIGTPASRQWEQLVGMLVAAGPDEPAIDSLKKGIPMMRTPERLRLLGILGVIGGTGWVLTLLGDVVAHDTIYGSPSNYRIWESLLIVVMVLLFAAVVGLAASGATATSRLGTVGLGIALVGRLCFLLGEVSSFVREKDDEILLPIGAVLTAVGMVLAGVVILRAKRWTGWTRAMPLATGLYPFIAMFPIVALTGEPSSLAISLWGIFWIGLGLAICAEARSAPATGPLTPVSAYS